MPFVDSANKSVTKVRQMTLRRPPKVLNVKIQTHCVSKNRFIPQELIFENFIFSNEHQHRSEMTNNALLTNTESLCTDTWEVKTNYSETIAFVFEAKWPWGGGVPPKKTKKTKNKTNSNPNSTICKHRQTDRPVVHKSLQAGKRELTPTFTKTL